MPVISGLAVLFQSTIAISNGDMHWLMIFAGIIAFSMVAQAIGVIGSAIFAARTAKKIEGLSNSFESKISPILTKTSAMIDDLSPKIRSVSENVEQISYTVREKCDEIGATLSQINQTVGDANVKTRVQVAKVNGLVSDALETTAEVSKVVHEGIRVPLRQIAGIIAGVRAGLDTLARKSPFGKGKGFENPYDL